MAAVPGYENGLVQSLLECGHQGSDPGGGTLEENLFPDTAPHSHFIQVILPDAVQC